MLKESAIKFYGIGIVLYDKIEGSTEIHAVPVEDMSQLQGKLREIVYDYDIKVPDHQGIKRTDSMKGGVSLTAKWINIAESNRTTAPDVYAHETVLLVRVADSEQIYWTDMLNETSLRRLETVRYSFSNKSSGFEPYDGDSSYWLEFDTRNKHVKLHTADNDGEYTKYDIEILTREGSITIKDDEGNSIFLDSRANRLEVTTVDSMLFKTKKMDFEAEDITLKGSSSIKLEAPNIDLNGSGAINVAGGAVELSGSSVTCNGDDLKIDKT